MFNTPFFPNNLAEIVCVFLFFFYGHDVIQQSYDYYGSGQIV